MTQLKNQARTVVPSYMAILVSNSETARITYTCPSLQTNLNWNHTNRTSVNCENSRLDSQAVNLKEVTHQIEQVFERFNMV